MSTIKWKWGAEPRNKGNEGFNDAGILTFNSHAINSFVRELFQNSNDAKARGKKKIIIRIDYCKIDKTIIPAFDQYLKILERVKLAHPSQAKFFKKAYNSLKGNTIPFLVYSDSNTKGLEGTEDDSFSSFDACVLSEGISAKEDGNAGGSFGIGKNAIFGVSNLRTVFYSSLNINGEYIFQGVAKLASYKLNSQNHEGRVYLGNGEKRLSVRNKKNIPKTFIRDNPGLSQFIMGVELSSDWQIEFAKAIIRNYWMLLAEGSLEVELCQDNDIIMRIDSKNIVILMGKLFSNEDEEYTLTPYGNPYLFFDAYTKGTKTEFDIPIIGKCSFSYLQADDAENNIAYLRNGMVVFSDIERRLVGASVTGVFRCNTNEGNAILRQMEPPKHDNFEPEMLENKHEALGKKDGDKILKAIKHNIRNVIKNLIEKYKQETETPVFLTELFEDLQKGFVQGDKGQRRNEKNVSEVIYRRAIEDIFDVNLISEGENTFISTNRANIEGPGANVAEKGNWGKKGQIQKGKSKKTKRKVPQHPVKGRIFFYSESKGRNIYKAVLVSDIEIPNTRIAISQYADSGKEVAFTLHRVTDPDGNEREFNELKDSDGLISEYSIQIPLKEGNNFLLLEISDNQKSAFVINA